MGMLVRMAQNGACLAVGWTGWTFLEYGIHRWVGHEGAPEATSTRIHLDHHRTPEGITEDTTYAEVLRHMAPHARDALVIINVTLLPVVGARRAWWISVGLVGGWLIQEYLHLETHRREPGNPYEAWAWRHHLAHHFTNPAMNHGMTTDLWDRVFGTLLPEGDDVTVPAGKAPPWLRESRPGYRVAGRYRTPAAHQPLSARINDASVFEESLVQLRHFLKKATAA